MSIPPTTPPTTPPTAPPGTDDRERDPLVGQGHTPDSWARALLSAVVADLEARDGPLTGQTMKLRVTAREIPTPPSDEGEPGLVHPHVLLCVHAPGSEHGYCLVFPPVFTGHR